MILNHPFHVEGWDGEVETLVADLSQLPAIDPSRLFPSDDKTRFGDWVKAGGLKIGDKVSTLGSVPDFVPQDNNTGPRVAANDNTPLTVTGMLRDNDPTRVYNFEVESQDGQITHNYFVGNDQAWVHNSDFEKLRRAYEEACKKIGGCKGLPKFLGKWGSPSRGDQKCGIRLDPADDRRGPHINWWDWRGGKRGGGGESGHIDL